MYFGMLKKRNGKGLFEISGYFGVRRQAHKSCHELCFKLAFCINYWTIYIRDAFMALGFLGIHC